MGGFADKCPNPIQHGFSQTNGLPIFFFINRFDIPWIAKFNGITRQGRTFFYVFGNIDVGWKKIEQSSDIMRFREVDFDEYQRCFQGFFSRLLGMKTKAFQQDVFWFL